LAEISEDDLFLTGVLKKPRILDFIRVRNYLPVLDEISEEDLFLTGARNYPPVLAEISDDGLFLTGVRNYPRVSDFIRVRNYLPVLDETQKMTFFSLE
jgi:hypothetical protein